MIYKLPECYSVILKLNFRNREGIGKVKLSNINKILKKLPPSSNISILTSIGNNFEFIPVKSIKSSDEIIQLYSYRTVNNTDIFRNPVMDNSHIVANSNQELYKNYSSSVGFRLWKDFKNVKTDQKKGLIVLNNKISINKLITKEAVKDYLRFALTDSKLLTLTTSFLIENGMLYSLLFSNLNFDDLVVNNKLFIPSEHFGIFNMLYGKKYNIVTSINNTIFTPSEYEEKSIILRKTFNKHYSFDHKAYLIELEPLKKITKRSIVYMNEIYCMKYGRK